WAWLWQWRMSPKLLYLPGLLCELCESWLSLGSSHSLITNSLKTKEFLKEALFRRGQPFVGVSYRLMGLCQTAFGAQERAPGPTALRSRKSLIARNIC